MWWMMSFRTRRQLKLSDVEPKVIKVEEEVVIEPIVIKEEVEKEVLEKLVEEVVKHFCDNKKLVCDTGGSKTILEILDEENNVVKKYLHAKII